MLDDKWKTFKNCVDVPVNDFFDNYERSVEVQLRIDKLCSNCIVRAQCLEWAIQEGLEGGVFGRKYITQGNRSKKYKKEKHGESVGSTT